MLEYHPHHNSKQYKDVPYFPLRYIGHVLNEYTDTVFSSKLSVRNFSFNQ